MDKLVVIINNLGIGGAERLVVDTLEELSNRRMPLLLITLRKEPANSMGTSVMSGMPIRWECIEFTSIFSVPGWVRLIRLLRKEKPRAVMSHLWFANTIGRIAARLAGVRTVLSFEHNVYDSVKTQRQFLTDRFLQGLSTRILAVSQAVKESLVQHGIADERISVLTNAVPLKRYGNAEPTQIRKELKLDESAFLFIYIGRLINQKGVDVLLNAFAKVSGGNLLVVGAGSDEKALRQIASDQGISSRVHFLGIRKDIPGLLKASDCFVLPSRWEGLGVVVLEALAAGKPIIVSDFAAAREMIEDKIQGLIVPVDDTMALSAAMENIFTSAELRQNLAKEALSRAGTFSMEAYGTRLFKHLR